MTITPAGVQGAKLQSWRSANPRSVLEGIIQNHPSASERELANEFWLAIQTDEDALKVIVLDYWFPNNYRSFFNEKQKLSPQQRAAAKKRKEELKEQIKHGVTVAAKRMLLDITMPNGKKLRDCTGGECTKLGGWMSRIGAKVKPKDKVGDVLSEAELKKLYDAEPTKR